LHGGGFGDGGSGKGLRGGGAKEASEDCEEAMEEMINHDWGLVWGAHGGKVPQIEDSASVSPAFEDLKKPQTRCG